MAYLSKDQLRQVRRMGPMLGEIADSPRVDRVPVYTAPSAEQVENWRHDSEDLEALHHNLDDAGVPRCDSAGIEYSAWGRVIQYAKAAATPPAVQVEPVATVTEEVFGSDCTSDFISARLPVGTKLYAAQQHAEQQPAPDVVGPAMTTNKPRRRDQ